MMGGKKKRKGSSNSAPPWLINGSILGTYIPTYRKLVTQYIQNPQKQTSVRHHRVKMEVPVKTDLGATSVLVEVASLGHIVKRVRWHSLITHTCYAMRGDIRHLFDCKGCVVWGNMGVHFDKKHASI